MANDVIQNSKKKGPEYRTEFVKVLPRVFQGIHKLVSDFTYIPVERDSLSENTNARVCGLLRFWIGESVPASSLGKSGIYNKSRWASEPAVRFILSLDFLPCTRVGIKTILW